MEKYPVKRNCAKYSDDDLIKRYNRSVINFTQALREKDTCDGDYLNKRLCYLRLRLAKEEKETLLADMKLRRLIT